ncbi:lipoyl(octanoyl) transferase [Rhodoligotrophos appendicifer]|uniref:lipoyl(octanoyl) transferase LipB n=1 Tax=Rhodoligotrophos appendicifer TaxID=987056 RepID=UPI001185B45B|nr:lipoyl(octanoyl) transferase LipB [Rhodoligotrophos appendicifer]
MLDKNIAKEAATRLFRSAPSVEWSVAKGLVEYAAAVDQMEARVAEISAGGAAEQVWLLEHPPLYTAGTSADDRDLLTPARFPVHRTGRGGQFTYHGPGQRVAYVMLDLSKRGQDLRLYVHELENWLIDSLFRFGVTAVTRSERIGVWVTRRDREREIEEKIAAIGIRVRRWVSFHGIALNINPELEHFSGIVPCGVHQHGVTSLADLGISAGMDDVDEVLRAEFEKRFGPTKRS